MHGSEPWRDGQSLSLLSCVGRIVSSQFSRMARDRTVRGEEVLVFRVLGIEGIALAGARDWRCRKRALLVESRSARRRGLDLVRNGPAVSGRG